MYSVFYKSCTALKSVVVQEEFNVPAYPNPYTENFNLSATSSSEDKVGVMVYDMIGKLIEKRTVSPS